MRSDPECLAPVGVFNWGVALITQAGFGIATASLALSLLDFCAVVGA